LLLFTGCRKSEILTLRWDHVDLERGTLLLEDAKTGKRYVLLSAPALAVLATLQRIRIGSYVIAGDDPEQPRSDLNRPWRAIVKRAGLAGVRLHDLRHSFGSVGAGGHLGLPIIGKLLGHRNPATTLRYVHLADDPLRRASESIAGTIAAAMNESPAAPSAEIVPLHRGKAPQAVARRSAGR
jgi:integrase